MPLFDPLLAPNDRQPKAEPRVKTRLRTLPAEGRYPSAILLAAARSIDEYAEIIHIGGGHWWLGVISMNDHREQQGIVILQAEEERESDYSLPPEYRKSNPRNVMLGLLLREGFARINGYTTDGDPGDTVRAYDGYDCKMIEDFRERDYWWHYDGGKSKALERIAESAGEPERERSQAASLEYLVNDGRAHWRREMRDRKMFGAAGVTGGRGSGSIITLGG